METITKISKVKNKETGKLEEVSKTYVIDASYAPTDISDICMEFIINYCKANKEVKWLKATVQKTIVDKNGKERIYPFVSLRSDFATKFFPSIVKGTKKKKESYLDLIMALDE